MKKEIMIICAIVLFTAGSASAAITVYPNDRPGWESAVGVYEEEFFTDATLNPGVSVVSDYPGYVNTTKGVWWDKLVCPDDGLTTTTWQFDTPIFSYGGNWNPGEPGGPGAHIAVAVNGSWVNIGEIPSTYTDQFWGFVSTEPFSAVRLSPGSNCSPPGGAWCETYEINSMVYSISEPCIERSFTDTTLFETLLAQKAVLNDVTVSGDFNSTLNFTDFEIVSITTGPFAGKGFSKGQFETTLEGILYQGEWKGASFLKPEERKIYLKGAISGEISATVEGYLTESDSGSGVYEQYQATWKIGRLGMTTTSATVNLYGTVSYQSSSESPATELYVLQTNIEGNVYGDYSGPLSTVLTHLRVVEETNPYSGEGFSIISYTSESGSGEGFTYDKVVSTGRVELKGLFTSPLFGIVSAALDESMLPRTLLITIERIDLGLLPMADLKIITWGPGRVSPGQTVNYIIEYRNDGLKIAENTVLFYGLDHLVNYVSSSHSFYNDENGVIRMDLGTVNSEDGGLIRVTGDVDWGLNQGTPLGNSAKIYTESAERDLSEDPDVTQWRNNLQPGDVVLAKHKDSIVPGYWDHAGGVVYGTYTDHWTGKTYEGWFMIEAVPRGVIVNDIKNWDYPRADYKEDVVILRVNSLTPEQRNYLFDFWNHQINKPYQNPVGSVIDPSIDAPSWYCSELVWAPYHNLGIEFNTSDYTPWAIAPSEIYESEDVTTISFYHKGMFGADVNSDEWTSTIAVARDPNIKYGPQGYVQPGQKLDYKVEYENEGEGIAFGVYFTDILDEDLDHSTLTIGPVIDVETGVEIAPPGTYNPETRTITWLVGEVGPGQGGYAEFSVNVRSDAPLGTEVINYATVYFPSVPEITKTNGVVCIIPTNRPPTADAGPDQSVECTSPDGAQVTLDGTGSSDPDNDPLTFTWCENGSIIAGPSTDPISTVTLALGTYAIELTVDDGQGETDTDEVVINVAVPVCKAFLTPDKLNVMRDPEHSFKVHVHPCDPMDVSVGDTAEVYLDIDDNGSFDSPECYLAIVSSTDSNGEATDIAVKLYDVPLLAEIDPFVAIYRINNIPIVDTLGNPIDYLQLTTFSPHRSTTKSALPEQVTLSRNYPNPFNPTTSIAFTLPFSTNWSLKIYNVAGQLVKSFEGYSSGHVSVTWNGKNSYGNEVSSGIYFYKLTAGDFTTTKKMVLIK